MKEIHEVIDILKGLQATDGEYDHYRETKLYEALRLLESFVEEKPIQVSPDPAIVAQAGVWADEKPEPVSVTINNDPMFDMVTGGIRRIPTGEAASESLRRLSKAFKNMGNAAGSAAVQLQRPEKHPFNKTSLRMEELGKQRRIVVERLGDAEAHIAKTIQSSKVPDEESYSYADRLHQTLLSIDTELDRITNS